MNTVFTKKKKDVLAKDKFRQTEGDLMFFRTDGTF